MALRVLLADESVTIKKVFQLALQDFAVEVTTVNVGLDVVQVALKTNPDIIFADVLLQKLNGYDVSREIKAHPQLKHIPVVLIWSGFMELDEARYKASGASAHLEKPFDTQHLRKLIQGLVPKTNTQPLSEFLNFPKLPDFSEQQKAAAPIPLPSPKTQETAPPIPMPPPRAPQAASHEPTPTTTGGEWTMDNFDSIEHTHFPPAPGPANGDDLGEEFVAVQLPNEPTRPKAPALSKFEKLTEKEDESGGQWVQRTLTNFKLAPEKRVDETPSVKYKVPQEKINPDELITNTWSGQKSRITQTGRSATLTPPLPDVEEVDQDFELDLGEPDTKSAKRDRSAVEAASEPVLSEKQIEAIIRSQAKEVIEKVVWQVVPEVATRIIERELERLLKERHSP